MRTSSTLTCGYVGVRVWAARGGQVWWVSTSCPVVVRLHVSPHRSRRCQVKRATPCRALPCEALRITTLAFVLTACAFPRAAAQPAWRCVDGQQGPEHQRVPVFCDVREAHTLEQRVPCVWHVRTCGCGGALSPACLRLAVVRAYRPAQAWQARGKPCAVVGYWLPVHVCVHIPPVVLIFATCRGAVVASSFGRCLVLRWLSLAVSSTAWRRWIRWRRCL